MKLRTAQVRSSLRLSARRGSLNSTGSDRSSAGFSLLELLLVVVILVLLTTISWGPRLGTRQNKQLAACRVNLQKISIALSIYANDNNGKFPQVTGAKTSEEALDVLVPKYQSDTALFICPSSKDSAPAPGESLRKQRISYAYYMGRESTNGVEALMSDRQVDTNRKSTNQTVFSTTGKGPGNNHGKSGGNFLFTDGHVESSPVRLAFPIEEKLGVVLLNPKP